MDIILYNSFLIESSQSSISEFLKSQYNHIFPDPTQSLNNLFNSFTKSLETDKNVSTLYQNYLKNSQTITQKEINNSKSVIEVDKVLTECIKYFYFSLIPVINKLQNDEFTVNSIFGRSRDKNLIALMSYPEDKFSNAVSTYVAGIKPKSGTTTNTTTVAPTTTTTTAPTVSESITDRINYKIDRILEADYNTNENSLVNYKNAVISWIKISLFDLIKPKLQLLRQIGNNTSNSVDQLANQMKGTTNENAKKMILNKIFNMNKEELQNLVNTLGLTKEQLGDL